jgi:hypothetical protein
MSYTPTSWVEGVTTVGPTNLNKIETELARPKTNADLDPVAAIALSKLADPGTGNVVTSVGAGAIAAKPPGYRMAYVEFVANVVPTGTTAATAIDVVSAGAITFDGATTVDIEFYSYGLSSPSAIGSTLIDLWDASTDLGIMAQALNSAASTMVVPCLVRRTVTPSAGSHTYKARVWATSLAGAFAGAGAGGAGVVMPGYIKITKV